MGNSSNSGLHITPLTLWVAGALGGALWAVLFVLAMSSRDSQARIQESVTTLVTSQQYDRKEIDAVKGEVRAVQIEVRGLADRMGKVEARR
jgi:hypothetical protein